MGLWSASQGYVLDGKYPLYQQYIRARVVQAIATAYYARETAWVKFARGTDVLLIEATLPRPERTGERGHLTPREAGEHARRAQARKVILTHFSDELDPDWARAEAGQAYGHDVELAREGAVYTVYRR